MATRSRKRFGATSGVSEARVRSHEEYMARFEAEERWFRAQRRRLASEHPGARYVAVSRRTPVLFGDSLIEVAREFAAAFGDAPVYIGQLTEELSEEVLSSPDW